MKNKSNHSLERNFDGGMGGTGAGSPGVSSAGNMGGNTNRGMRALKPGEESKAKVFALKKMRESSYSL